jgi:hypothetical protein
MPTSGLGSPRRPASKKPYKGQAHTPASSKGMGDYYGTGVRAKLGRMRDGMGMQTLSKNQLSKPPRSLV